MIKIGAFIIPEKKIKIKILKLKKVVKKKFGNQPYLSHPPHCTLFTMNVPANIIRKKNKLKILKIKKNYKNIVAVKKTGLFTNDPITGGQTIFFKITKNSFLNQLQIKLLTLFLKFRIKKKTKLKFSWMQKNNVKYGYSFVGRKWLPHFTIASLTSLNEKNKFIRSFLNKKIKYRELVKKVYIYKITRDKHTYLWTLNIN